jgi:hypothetical protein
MTQAAQIGKKNKTHRLLKLMRFWPPFWGMNIRVTEANEDLTRMTVEMGLHFWNKNYVGTQFGGALYAMVDPFYMLMFIENLGPDYIVWDKAAHIQFKKPGRGKVRATFELTQEQIAAAKKAADENPKVEPVFNVQILNEIGEVVAEVEKTLYIKRKDKAHT